MLVKSCCDSAASFALLRVECEHARYGLVQIVAILSFEDRKERV